MRKVPASIPRPEYADTGTVSPPIRGEREIKTPEELVRMRRACRAAALVLREVGTHVRPGVTTDELDAVAHAAYIRLGGYPSTLNYHGYPKSLCTSVNEVICHGIPDDRALEDGDIVNLDITIFLNGMHGDCSATFPVGNISPQNAHLIKVTHEAMMVGIAQVKPGRPIRDIGRAIEQHAGRFNMGSVRAFCGHGIGARFHTTLQIPHYDDKNATTIMQAGMTFTVEPMITLGSWRHNEWDDGWTAVTTDGRNTAQFEHTLLVTDDGYEILTLAEDGAAP